MRPDQRLSDEFAALGELMSTGESVPERPPLDAGARRRRRRRGWLVAGIVVAVVLAVVGGYSGWALAAPTKAPVAASAPPQVLTPEPADIELPETGSAAISVAGASEYLGAGAEGIWLTSGSARPRPIASLTKLITALVVLDAKPLDGASDPGPMITFGERDHDLYDQYYVLGATVATMPAGVRMSQHDALTAMLVPSASNYADAVSTWAFGSRWAFLAATQAWLDEHGLTQTTIVEPTGIDPRNVSTPKDLIAIGKLAAAHPAIASIVSEPWVSIPGAGAVYNTNALLGSSGITGLKTGNLGPDTCNLLFSAQIDVGLDEPLSVIGVVLGGPSRQWVNASVRLMIDSIRAGFHNGVPLAQEGDVVGSYSTAWGSQAKLVVAADAAILTWSDTPIEVALETKTPRTYVDGEEVGTITWTAGPHTVTVPVEVRGSIRPPDAWWRLTHPAELAG